MPGKRELAWIVSSALALIPIACGGSSEEGLYGGTGAKGGSGGLAGTTGGATSLGGVAGEFPTGGAAGRVASGGVAGADASPGSGGWAGAPPPPPPIDAGPEGNNPLACPPQPPAPGSPCNVFVNNQDCIYGVKHCVCTISSWLCVL